MTISYAGRANSNNGGSGSGTDISTTLPSNTAGNLIVVGVGWVDDGSITAAVSDSKGNTYTACRAKTRNATNGYSIQEFYAWGIAGSVSTNTITADYSTLTTFTDIHVAEYTSSNGVWTADPLDKTNAATGNSTGLNSGTVTPAHNGELLVTVGFSNDGTISAGSGFTLRSTGANGVGLADLVQTTAAAKAGLLTTSVSSQWGIQVASFADAATATQTVSPAGIPTAETFSSTAVVATAVVFAEGIPGGDAFGSATVVAGAVTVSSTGIASAQAFGTPTAVASASIAPTGIPSAQTVDTASVSVTATISPGGIPTAVVLGNPTLRPGAVTVSPAGIPTTATVGAPTIAPGAVTIGPDGIPTAETLGTPAIASSATVSPAGIPSSATVGSPAIAGGTITLMPSGISTGQAFGEPIITATVAAVGIATVQAVPPPSVSGSAIVAPTGIASTVSLGTPAVSAGTATITPAEVATRQALGVPTVTIFHPGEFHSGPPMSVWIVGEPVTDAWTFAAPLSPWIAGWPDVDNISALSTQYVQVPVTELVSGLPADPTDLPVYGAFLLGRGEPADDDWLTGSWDSETVNGQYFAQVLVGPDGLKTLTPGQWVMWLKIDADPETPVMQAGTITVY